MRKEDCQLGVVVGIGVDFPLVLGASGWWGVIEDYEGIHSST